jgi:hypothetical protein
MGKKDKNHVRNLVICCKDPIDISALLDEIKTKTPEVISIEQPNNLTQEQTTNLLALLNNVDNDIDITWSEDTHSDLVRKLALIKNRNTLLSLYAEGGRFPTITSTATIDDDEDNKNDNKWQALAHLFFYDNTRNYDSRGFHNDPERFEFYPSYHIFCEFIKDIDVPFFKEFLNYLNDHQKDFEYKEFPHKVLVLNSDPILPIKWSNKVIRLSQKKQFICKIEDYIRSILSPDSYVVFYDKDESETVTVYYVDHNRKKTQIDINDDSLKKELEYYANKRKAHKDTKSSEEAIKKFLKKYHEDKNKDKDHSQNYVIKKEILLNLLEHVKNNGYLPYEHIELKGAYVEEKGIPVLMELFEEIALKCPNVTSLKVIEYEKSHITQEDIDTLTKFYEEHPSQLAIAFKNPNSVPLSTSQHMYKIDELTHQKKSPEDKELLESYRLFENKILLQTTSKKDKEWKEWQLNEDAVTQSATDKTDELREAIRQQLKQIKKINSPFLNTKRSKKLQCSLSYEHQQQQEIQQQQVVHQQEKVIQTVELNQEQEAVSPVPKGLRLLDKNEFYTEIHTLDKKYEYIRKQIFAHNKTNWGIQKITSEALEQIVKYPDVFNDGLNFQDFNGFIIQKMRVPCQFNGRRTSNSYFIFKEDGKWSLYFTTPGDSDKFVKLYDDTPSFQALLQFLNDKYPNRNDIRCEQLYQLPKKDKETIINFLTQHEGGAELVLHYDPDLYYQRQREREQTTTPLMPKLVSSKKEKSEGADWSPIKHMVLHQYDDIVNKALSEVDDDKNTLQNIISKFPNYDFDAVRIKQALAGVVLIDGQYALIHWLTALNTLIKEDDDSLLRGFFNVFAPEYICDYFDDEAVKRLPRLLNNDSLVRLHKMALFTTTQKQWWLSLTEQHANAGNHVDFATLFDAFEYFCLQLNKKNLVLPKNCLQGVKNMPVSLQRLLTILNKSPNPQWQLDNLEGVSLSMHGAAHAIDEGYFRITKEMKLSAYNIKLWATRDDDNNQNKKPTTHGPGFFYNESSGKLWLCAGNGHNRQITDTAEIKDWLKRYTFPQSKDYGYNGWSNEDKTIEASEVPLSLYEEISQLLKNKPIEINTEGSFESMEWSNHYPSMKQYYFSFNLDNFCTALTSLKHNVSFENAQRLFYRYLGQERYIPEAYYDNYAKAIHQIEKINAAEYNFYLLDLDDKEKIQEEVESFKKQNNLNNAHFYVIHNSQLYYYYLSQDKLDGPKPIKERSWPNENAVSDSIKKLQKLTRQKLNYTQQRVNKVVTLSTDNIETITSHCNHTPILNAKKIAQQRKQLLLILALTTTGKENATVDFLNDFNALVDILLKSPNIDSLLSHMIERAKRPGASIKAILNSSLIQEEKVRNEQPEKTVEQKHVEELHSSGIINKLYTLQLFEKIDKKYKDTFELFLWQRPYDKQLLNSYQFTQWLKEVSDFMTNTVSFNELLTKEQLKIASDLAKVGSLLSSEGYKTKEIFNALQQCYDTYGMSTFSDLLQLLTSIKEDALPISCTLLINMIPVKKEHCGGSYLELYHHIKKAYPKVTLEPSKRTTQSGNFIDLFFLGLEINEKEQSKSTEEKQEIALSLIKNAWKEDYTELNQLLVLTHQKWLKNTHGNPLEQYDLLNQLFSIAPNNEETSIEFFERINEKQKELEAFLYTLEHKNISEEEPVLQRNNNERHALISVLNNNIEATINCPRELLLLLLRTGVSPKGIELTLLSKLGALDHFKEQISLVMKKRLTSAQQENILNIYLNTVSTDDKKALTINQLNNLFSLYNTLGHYAVDGTFLGKGATSFDSLLSILLTYDEQVNDLIEQLYQLHLSLKDNKLFCSFIVLLSKQDKDTISKLLIAIGQCNSDKTAQIIKVIMAVGFKEDILEKDVYGLILSLNIQEPSVLNKLVALYEKSPAPTLKQLQKGMLYLKELDEDFQYQFEINPYDHPNRMEQFKVSSEDVINKINGMSDLFKDKGLLWSMKQELLKEFTYVNAIGHSHPLLPIPEACSDIKSVPVKDLSQENITRLLQAYRMLLSDKGLDKNERRRITLACIALLREVMYRSNGVMLYPVQILGMLAMTMDKTADMRFKFLRAFTGEGKKELSVFLGVLRGWLQGRPVDICVSNNRELTYTSFQEMQSFFSYFKVSTIMIGADATESDYDDNEVHFATVGDLANFRSRLEYEHGHKTSLLDLNEKDEIEIKEVKNIKKTPALILDEGDEILLHEKTTYIYATNTKDNVNGINPYEWLYPLINDFIDSQDYKLLSHNEKTLCQDEVIAACDYILEKIQDDRSKMQQFLYWLGGGDEQSDKGVLQEFIEEKINKWISSAIAMAKQERGINYIVDPNYSKKVHGKVTQVSEVILLSEANQRPIESKYSDGGQQLLTDRVKRTIRKLNSNNPFVFEPELESVAKKTNKNFLDFYLIDDDSTVDILAATTHNSDKEAEEIQEKYNLLILGLPYHKESQLKEDKKEVTQENYLATLLELLENASKTGLPPVLIHCENAKIAEDIYSYLKDRNSSYSMQLHTGEKTIYKNDELPSDKEREKNAINNAGLNGVCTISNIFDRGSNIKVEDYRKSELDGTEKGGISISVGLTTVSKEIQRRGRVARQAQRGISITLVFPDDKEKLSKDELHIKRQRDLQDYAGDIENQFYLKYQQLLHKRPNEEGKKKLTDEWKKYSRWFYKQWKETCNSEDTDNLAVYVKNMLSVACIKWKELLAYFNTTEIDMSSYRLNEKEVEKKALASKITIEVLQVDTSQKQLTPKMIENFDEIYCDISGTKEGEFADKALAFNIAEFEKELFNKNATLLKKYTLHE